MKWWQRILMLLLLSFLTFQIARSILIHSATFDEISHIAHGVLYTKANRIDLGDPIHPPFLKYLIGLALWDLWLPLPDESALTSGPNYYLGYDLLYESGDSPDVILKRSRIPTLLLSIALALLVFLWSRRWFGPTGGLISLCLYATDPTVLAHSSFATLDVGGACFLFMSCFFLVLWGERRKFYWLFLTGVSAALAVGSKLPNGIFFVWLVAYLIFNGITGKTDLDSRRIMLAFLTICVTALVGIILIYQGRHFPMFVESLREAVSTVFHGRSSSGSSYNFFHGIRLSEQLWYYFAGAALIKTPLPTLFLYGLGAWALKKDRRALYLFVPIISYFLFCSQSNYQRGIRYLIPIFPFACVAAGSLASAKGRKFSVVLGFLGWSALEASMAAPHFVSYFNQSVGGPKNGYKWLLDSNLDWGQDLKKLAALLKKNGNPEIITAIHGTANLDYYLGLHQDLIAPLPMKGREFSHVNSKNPQKEWLIVSPTYWQGFFSYTYADPFMFEWLRAKKPMTAIGHSLFIYDVTRDTGSHWHMAQMYQERQLLKLAARELERTQ